MNKTDSHVVHYPDLKFVNFCYNYYGINRGVFNIIDEWFYNKGIEDIVERRSTIVAFLEDLKISFESIRFGHGGLKKSLNTFYSKKVET